MGERRCVHRVLVGKHEGENHLEDPRVDGMMILKWIFRMWQGEVWTGLIWLRVGKGGRHLELHNEPSGSIKWEEFLD
jgi:hypothetical protein